MWSIVVVLSGLLTGPEIHAVTEAGIFKTEESCEAAIAEGVKTKLEGDAKKEYEGGYRKFVCVKAMGSDALEHLQ
ncbi:hypothetical protein [Parvibaculum sp.]|jgi:hypothetical protein|uniref:hypothetical protein n=1 Tax=Parvibaculum sp. TaxID=2024848 RepID=UPI002FDA2917